MEWTAKRRGSTGRKSNGKRVTKTGDGGEVFHPQQRHAEAAATGDQAIGAKHSRRGAMPDAVIAVRNA